MKSDERMNKTCLSVHLMTDYLVYFYTFMTKKYSKDLRTEYILYDYDKPQYFHTGVIKESTQRKHFRMYSLHIKTFWRYNKMCCFSKSNITELPSVTRHDFKLLYSLTFA